MAIRKRKRPVAKPEKAKHTQALRKLAPIAKDVNARLVSADKSEGKADDMRLAAAIRLNDAKAICEKEKINFKKWAEEHVEQAYETVRQLVRVGGSDEPKLALADMRAKTAKRVAKSRAKAKPTSGSAASVGGRVTQQAKPPYMVAVEASETLDDKTRGRLAKQIAEGVGMQVLSVPDAEKLMQGQPTLSAAKQAADRLGPEDRRKLLVHVTEKVEQDVANAAGGSEFDADRDMPASLRRKKKKGRGRRVSA